MPSEAIWPERDDLSADEQGVSFALALCLTGERSRALTAKNILETLNLFIAGATKGYAGGF